MKINVKFVVPGADTLTEELFFHNKTSRFLTIVVLFILEVTLAYKNKERRKT